MTTDQKVWDSNPYGYATLTPSESSAWPGHSVSRSGLSHTVRRSPSRAGRRPAPRLWATIPIRPLPGSASSRPEAESGATATVAPVLAVTGHPSRHRDGCVTGHLATTRPLEIIKQAATIERAGDSLAIRQTLCGIFPCHFFDPEGTDPGYQGYETTSGTGMSFRHNCSPMMTPPPGTSGVTPNRIAPRRMHDQSA